MRDPRYVIGALIVLLLFALAFTIAIGKVEESTSYGLNDVLKTLQILTAAFAGWAFGQPPQQKGGG